MSQFTRGGCQWLEFGQYFSLGSTTNQLLVCDKLIVLLKGQTCRKFIAMIQTLVFEKHSYFERVDVRIAYLISRFLCGIFLFVRTTPLNTLW